MSTITFDTLELVKQLKNSGIAQEQAEAIVSAMSKAQDNLVTRDYLEISLSPIKTDLAILKLMMAFLLAGMLSIIIKTFF